MLVLFILPLGLGLSPFQNALEGDRAQAPFLKMGSAFDYDVFQRLVTEAQEVHR